MNQAATPTLDREAIAAAMFKASQTIGGQAEMARLLRVSAPMVYQWCKGLRIVPADYCPAIERLTRERNALEPSKVVVVCEELRPDVEWGVLRLQSADQATAAGG